MRILACMMISCLLTAVPAYADTDVADSWSVIQKGIGGVFADTAGNWVDYTMTDTDASGRQYIDLQQREAPPQHADHIAHRRAAGHSRTDRQWPARPGPGVARHRPRRDPSEWRARRLGPLRRAL